MSSLKNQTVWSAMQILFTSVISIVSVPIYFRVLGDQMYAMWFYVGTLTGAFGFCLSRRNGTLATPCASMV